MAATTPSTVFGGDDVIFGEIGNDSIRGGSGDDVIDGGVDTDTVVYDDSLSGVVVRLDFGIALGGAEDDTLTRSKTLGIQP